VGFFAISTPAEAGFFDWLFGSKNTSSQEAAAIKAQTVKKVAPTTQVVETNTGTGPYNPLPVQTVDKVAPGSQTVDPVVMGRFRACSNQSRPGACRRDCKNHGGTFGPGEVTIPGENVHYDIIVLGCYN